MAPIIAGLSELKPIGRGGSAHVYSATRDAFGDRVAVKVLNQALTNATIQRQFEKESESLRQLADVPGVVAVLDLGVTDAGDPYLVMPLFEGGSATRLINEESPLDWREATRLISDASDAVHTAHQRGIWHRDIKPGNILLTSTGRPFVADFGIAKLLADSGTTTGASSFTPRYAAPEVLSGEHTAQSDVYSLAATFVALVTGHAPFSDSDGSVVAIVNDVLHSDPPNIEDFNIPQPVAAVISRAMSKDPADRQSTPGEFASQLRAQLADADTVGAETLPPVRHEPPVSPSHDITSQATAAVDTAPPDRRLPLAIGAALAAVAIAGGAWFLLGGSNNAAAPTTVSTSTSDDDGGSDDDGTSGAAVVDGADAETIAATDAAPADDDKADAEPADPDAVVVEAPTADSELDDSAEADIAGGESSIHVEADGSGDVATLAEAVTAAAPHAVISLGPGAHNVDGQILLSRPVTIAGQGPNSTIVVAAGRHTALYLNAPDINIVGVTVTTESGSDSSEAGLALIQTADAVDFALDNVVVTRASDWGLITWGSSTGTIASSAFLSNAGGGAAFGDESDVTVIGNLAEGNAGSGFAWWSQAQGVVSTNTAKGNGTTGFVMVDNAQPVLVNNLADSNNEQGFAWTGDSTGIATANVATANGFDGFAAFDTAHPTWTSNVSESNGGEFFRGPESGATLDEGQVLTVNIDGSGDVIDLPTAIGQGTDGTLIRLGPGEHRVDARLDLSKAIVVDGAGSSSTTISSERPLPVITVTGGATISNLRIVSSNTDSPDFAIVEITDAPDFAIVAVDVGTHPGAAIRVHGESFGNIIGVDLTSSGDTPLDISDEASVTALGY